jgi:osmotically-inducible protein OsmY
LQQEVRDLIHRDPTLTWQSLNVHVQGGEAIIGGTVQHDAQAVAAAHDALAVPGVVAVQLQTESAESPVHTRLVATTCG